MASGGKRPGSGRKAKAVKYQPQINKAEKRIADRLPQLIHNLEHLADGGYERVKEKSERVPKKRPDGSILLDSKGEIIYEFVVTERTVEIADKDRAANEYLINRILGKPTERQEIETEVKGEITVNDQAKKAAASELGEWQKEQLARLQEMQKNSPSATPT